MKHFIDIKNTTFNVSDSVISAITKSNLNFQIINREGKKIRLLDDSTLSSFLLVPIKSSTHRYIEIGESNKIRVNKLFYDFLVSCSKQRNVKKTQNTKTTTSLSLDKFYTKPEISDFCVNVFGSNIKVEKQDLIVEPSAGGGSFIKKLKELKCNTIFLDIAPEDKQIKQANFLDWRPPQIEGKIHVIGNPPFGRQSSKCHKFIEHAAGFADTISFILPISFKKDYNIAKIPANLHLMKEVLLPKNSFLKKNVTFALPTVFQI